MKPAIHNRNIAVAHDLVITVLHQLKSSICTHAGQKFTGLKLNSKTQNLYMQMPFEREQALECVRMAVVIRSNGCCHPFLFFANPFKRLQLSVRTAVIIRFYFLPIRLNGCCHPFLFYANPFEWFYKLFKRFYKPFVIRFFGRFNGISLRYVFPWRVTYTTIPVCCYNFLLLCNLVDSQ